MQVHLVNPDEEWELHAAWFIKPQRFDVYITERGKGDSDSVKV